MRILYNSRSTQFKTPFGVLEINQKCEIEVHIPTDCATIKAVLLIENDDDTVYTNIDMKLIGQHDLYDIYKCDFTISKSGLYFYYFRITTPTSGFSLLKYPHGDTNLEAGEKWQLTCCEKKYNISDSFKGEIMYQIFPDRFNQLGECDLSDKMTPYMIHQTKQVVPRYTPDPDTKVWNNDFFGGNLKGIEEKLKYLKTFNVGILYLNPIFMALSNHRYDTADYMRIDPMLGTEQDFISLCEKAHKLGIKILLDGVFSHTGADSVYFDKNNRFGSGAYHHKSSPYFGWFEFSKHPDEYTSWWGISTLPCVKELNPEFTEYIIGGEDSVVAHWLKLGADGFRLDVADELPDEFIKLLHDRVHELKEDSLVLGEVWEDASNKISYSVRRKYFSNNELDSTMNYPFKDGIIKYIKGDTTAEALGESIMDISENYPKDVLNCVMNSLSTHDTARILTVLGADTAIENKDDRAAYRIPVDEIDEAMERYRLAIFIQYMLPGNPCIYYGDEIGMQGFEDPLNRGYFDWDKSDEVSRELLELYREFGQIRKGNASIRLGSIDVIFTKDSPECFRFTRILNGEQVECICTVVEDGCSIDVDYGFDILISSGAYVEDDNKLNLKRNGYIAIRRK